jgi:uncharacterized protein YhhL (DUF1145 family)
MTLFQYTARNSDGKEIIGSIDAPDEGSARSAIEKTGSEILSVREATRERPSTKNSLPVYTETPSQIFAYEGKDSTGKIHRGTMQALTKKEAFEHLKSMQNLEVSMLSPLGKTPLFEDPDLRNWQQIRPSTEEAPNTDHATNTADSTHGYLSLFTTLRLYAGWLLAWYGFFVSIGYYSHVRLLPFTIPFSEAFFVSPLIFTFIVSAFLFLLFGTIAEKVHSRIFRIGMGVFGIFILIGIQKILNQ